MTKAEEKGLYKALESIKNQARKILEDIERYNSILIAANSTYQASTAEKILHQKVSETESLIKSFNEIKKEFTNLTDIELRTLSLDSNVETRRELFPSMDSIWKKGEFSKMEIPNKVGRAAAVLGELIVECNGAIGILEETISPIHSTERDKLEALRKELKDISTNVRNIHLETNLETAIEECEKGDCLASWLISGRVIRYILDKIPGGNIDEKMGFLKEKGIVSSDKKDTINIILKTDKETRDIASHNISSFPLPKDTISLLADSMKLLELIWIKLEELLQEKQ